MIIFKKKNSRPIAIILSLLMIFAAMNLPAMEKVNAASPEKGQLKVVGSQLCDSEGKAIQLKGMSSHGVQWYGQYMNDSSIRYLKSNWGANVVRAAMYTSENGYISNPEAQKAKVKEIVQAAIDAGVYVIIDWHILSDGNPNTYKTEAKAFFQEMAKTYGKYPNVIYEICNEPNGNVTWANDIKPYAQYIIPAIRAIDSDNVIIVGTSTWSQDVNNAADSPLSYANIMYACHFYAGTHGQSLRDKIDYAMSKGIAVFVTEWGTSDCSGNGGPFLDESQKWIDYMASKKISWTNWSLCDKGESSAALKAGASTTGGWTNDNLTESGRFVKKSIAASSKSNGTATSVSLTTPTSVPSKTVTPVPSTTSTNTTSKTTATTTTTTTTSSASSTTSTTNGKGATVTYDMYSWGNGATINVTIKNNSKTAMNGWNLKWAFPGNQKVTNIWNASYTKSGSTITSKNLSYNNTIPANGTQTFGFNISYSGSNTKPAQFILNGTVCK